MVMLHSVVPAVVPAVESLFPSPLSPESLSSADSILRSADMSCSGRVPSFVIAKPASCSAFAAFSGGA